MGHIFISYAREDRAFVGQLAREMTRRGIPVWDDSHLELGDAWYRTTEERLDASAAVVLVMSRASRDSTWVTNELLRAQRKGIPVRPLLLGGDPWLAVESVNFIDLRGGGSPDESFYADLREITSSTEHVDTDVSDDWFDATLFLPEARPDAHDAASGPAHPEQRRAGGLDDSAEAGQPSPDREQLAPANGRARHRAVPRGMLATAVVLVVLGGVLTWAIVAGQIAGERQSGEESKSTGSPTDQRPCCPWADDLPDSATVAIERNDIQVDGELDDWAGYPTWSLAVPLRDDLFGLHAADANTAQFAWNATYLFFAARVFDDEIIAKDPSLGGDLWTSDSVAFNIGFPASDDSEPAWNRLQDGDLRVKFAPSGEDPSTAAGLQAATGGDRFSAGNWDDFAFPTGAIVRDKQLPDRYTIEAMIPWVAIKPADWAPTAGRVLAMNVHASSTKSFETGGKPVISTTSFYRRGTPRCWGRVLLWSGAQAPPGDLLDELEPGDVSMCPRRSPARPSPARTVELRR